MCRAKESSLPTPSSALPLALVGGSGLLFALQGACMKVALARGIGALEFVEFRGTIQFLGALSCLIVLRPLPVKHWLGVSWHQRGWLTLRAAVGFLGIAFSMASLERLPMGEPTHTRLVTS